MKHRTKKRVRFVGWWRPDSGYPWRRLVSGLDETRVFNRLLDRVRGGDKTVLEEGRDPNKEDTT